MLPTLFSFDFSFSKRNINFSRESLLLATRKILSLYVRLQYLTNTDIKVHSLECLIKILASASLHKACIKTRSFHMLAVHVYFRVLNCLHIFH